MAGLNTNISTIPLMAFQLKAEIVRLDEKKKKQDLITYFLKETD